MYTQHKQRGLVIVAVPCNQFAAEEPWPEPQIKEWLGQQYNIQFPVLSKQDVQGENISPLFQYLKAKDGSESEIKWNFAKYLLDGEGNVRKFFEHEEEPSAMMQEIENLLG